MKIIYNNTELQHNTRSYNVLINRPSLNGRLLEGNISLDTLSLYDKPTVNKLVESVSQIRLVTEMPADPEPSMTYYVGPDERDLYDVILVNDAKQQIPMGTTQFGQYKSGQGINVKADNTINVNTDDVSIYVDSEGNIASSLDGEALPAFVGATASSVGQKGLAPKPLAGQQDYLLRGDSTWVEFVNYFFPVGTVYVTYSSSVNPNTLFTGTTWTKLASDDRLLWLNSTGGGGTRDAALPNLKGYFNAYSPYVSNEWNANGAYSLTSILNRQCLTSADSSSWIQTAHIEFSNENDVYNNNSGIVRAPSVSICAWQRTA